MAFEVAGWIEVQWPNYNEKEQNTWCDVVNLSSFFITGDYTSHTLFGLSKRMKSKTNFADRGIPSDCSDLVREEAVDNEEYIEVCGEGNFGYTYALWSEIKPLLDRIESENGISDQWKQAFVLAEALSTKLYSPDTVRFVVHGNW